MTELKHTISSHVRKPYLVCANSSGNGSCLWSWCWWTCTVYLRLLVALLLQEPLVTVRSVCWAAAVLLGRSFSLDLSEPELGCEGDMSYFGSWQAHGPASVVLVPWADMCQHSSDAGKGVC
jgi:hypothetical protein